VIVLQKQSLHLKSYYIFNALIITLTGKVFKFEYLPNIGSGIFLKSAEVIKKIEKKCSLIATVHE
jgi:hypothetical protein